MEEHSVVGEESPLMRPGEMVKGQKPGHTGVRIYSYHIFDTEFKS